MQWKVHFKTKTNKKATHQMPNLDAFFKANGFQERSSVQFNRTWVEENNHKQIIPHHRVGIGRIFLLKSHFQTTVLPPVLIRTDI